ncbi:anti-repressor SinI family protein [Paenibacillus sp. GSMTC-2017]|uniref:anti-repressor SinI family protein n=1 Tax=Paenibacillus sp. GSMTC-2017 TaxID=2794350 RepID=UPI0018D9694A|nr:anti-repressor SinI family protein [Paenibacillus sp. GSMTC-2017]MBH5317289.1 anti-repressor SinI family protein [Paenibacillus sp. GSMTC-2017]
MTLLVSDNQLELDKEWVELILQARDKGLSIDDVRKLLSTLREEGFAKLQESAV